MGKGVRTNEKKVDATSVEYADRGWWFAVEMDTDDNGNPPALAELLPNCTPLAFHGTHVFRSLLRTKEEMQLLSAIRFLLEHNPEAAKITRFFLCGKPLDFKAGLDVIANPAKWH